MFAGGGSWRHGLTFWCVECLAPELFLMEIGGGGRRETEVREESGFAAVGVAEEEDGYCWGVVHGQGARSTMGLAFYKFRAFVIY